MLIAVLLAATGTALPQSSVDDPLAWNERRAVELSALPLSCLDRPHQAQGGKPYIHEPEPTLRPDYEGTRAFYGCYDWHSAVNSTWALVKVLEDFPDVALAGLIREKLEHHLSKTGLEGEREYFASDARPGFERPYGWAWLLALQVELHTWDDPDAKRWAERLDPTARLLAERTLEYLDRLAYPVRAGTHDNTAFSLDLIRSYAVVMEDSVLLDAVDRRATEFFGGDSDCPIDYEPSGSDFLSPCLSEAVLMSRILDEAGFAEWLTGFLPSVDRFREAPVMKDHYLDLPAPTVDATDAEAEAGETDPDEEAMQQERRLAGARSHLVGLAFERAASLLMLAQALPAGDERRETYRSVAEESARHGFETMYDASYFGSHWLASFAVRMLTTAQPR